jgi:type I restriction enzyme, S subunit
MILTLQTISVNKKKEVSITEKNKKNWEVKKLGEVCNFQNGFAFKSKTYKVSGLPILRITNIQNQSLDIDEVVYFDPKDYKENFERYKVFKNDLVIAMSGATTGKLGINTTETIFYLNQRVGKFLPKKELLRSFLYYYLSTKVEESLRIAAGAAQPNLSTEQINNFIIPLPPLSEQKRIVAILDEAFAAIAKTKAIAEQNLKNARELFESYLQEAFSNKGKDWEEKTLREITIKIGSGATPRGGNESYKSEGISLIRSMNVHDREFREKNLAFIDEKQAKDLNNVTLQENDVLLNITGASVTRCCVIPKYYLPGRVNQHVSIIRPKKEIIDAFFLNMLLTSKFYKDQLLFTGEQGATRQAITKAQLEAFKVSYPSLPKQKEIVKKLDALQTETKKLEAIYQKKIDDLEELKKSILQRAFNGEIIV